MQTHAQVAIQSLGAQALDLPVALLTAIQKDATEQALTRNVLTEVATTTPSSRTQRLLAQRIPALDALHAGQSSDTLD